MSGDSRSNADKERLAKVSDAIKAIAVELDNAVETRKKKPNDSSKNSEQVFDKILTLLSSSDVVIMLAIASSAPIVSNILNLAKYNEDSKVISEQALRVVTQITKCVCAMAELPQMKEAETRVSKILGDSGACEVVLAIMGKHAKADPDFFQKVAQAVSLLATVSAENREKFKQAGAWTAFVEILGSEGKTSQTVAEQSLCAIERLTQEESQSLVTLARHVPGAMLYVITALRVHAKNSSYVVQEAFRQLTSADLSETSLVSTLGVLGACEAIAAAVTEQGPKSAPLAEMGAFLVGRLSAENADNRARFVAAGTCEGLVLCLKEHGGTKDGVAKQIFSALGVLITLVEVSGDVYDKMYTLGAAPAVVAAVKNATEKSNAVTVAMGCMFLATLAIRSPDDAAKLGDAGACEVVVQALKTYEDDAEAIETIEETLGALANLSLKDETNRSIMGRAGACPLVVSVRDKYRYRSSRVAELAPVVIKVLEMDPVNKMIMLKLQSGSRNLRRYLTAAVLTLLAIAVWYFRLRDGVAAGAGAGGTGGGASKQLQKQPQAEL